jgi:hypothetical protein
MISNHQAGVSTRANQVPNSRRMQDAKDAAPNDQEQSKSSHGGDASGNAANITVGGFNPFGLACSK